MNYKKSLLSLATVMALSNTVMADNTATYLPLTSSTTDSVWVLFGVNGFSDGTPSDLGTTTGSFQAGFTELEDTTTTDALATSGLAAETGSGNMASLQAVVISGVTSPTTLKVGMDMDSTVFNATEPVRTMYVKVNSASPNLKLDYKASLEGKGMEILINGVLYSVTISQDSTWANAIDATEGSLAAAVAGADRDDITEALDYNLSNNPVNPVHFDSTVHLDNAAAVNGASGAQTANMYHFNAITQQWEVWNKNSPTNGNDFTTLSKGQAYWGRVDVNDSIAGGLINNDGGATGLVLGQATALSGIPDPDVYKDAGGDTILSTGWNMLAFDNNKPNIRHAATGLVLQGVDINDTLVITDSSGLHSITYDINATANAGAVDETMAVHLNERIEATKLLGEFPGTFNIKAFYGGTSGKFILVSDEKFTVTEADGAGSGGGGTDINVTTLTGSNPYVAGVITAVSDLNGTNATSAYGEYTMMLDLMTADLRDDNVSAELDAVIGGGGTNVSAKIKFGDTDGDNTAIALTTATDGNPTLTTATTAITGDPIFDGTDGTGAVTGIDSDNDGDVDKVITASTIPFYVKDNTFVRVYTTATTGANGTASLTISGASSVTVTPDATPTAAEIAALVNAQADAAGLTGVYAAEGSTSTDLILVSTSNDLFDLKDADSASVDLLSPGADSNETAAGAIKGAWSLDYVASLPLVQHEITVDFTGISQPVDLDNAWDFNVTINGTNYNSNDYNVSDYTDGATVIVDSTAGRKAFFDMLVGEINRIIKNVSGVHAYAVHDYDVTTDDLTGTKILVAGVDVTDLNVSPANEEGLTVGDLDPASFTDANALTAGKIGSGLTTGNLASDVKSNPIYTPNFAIQGPLYTLRNAGDATYGYDVRAMIKATTEMDATTGNVAWDSIDITRNENDWFINNEFNLFKINHNAGYWVYLEEASAPTVSIGTATLSASAYTYYFDRSSSLTTSNVINNGQISVTITGLDDGSTEAGSAYAIISGEELQLQRTAGTDVFTADLSDYALQNFASSASPVDVKIRAVNGKGEAVEVASAISIDYTAPTNVAAADASVTGVTLTADGNVSNFYVFNGYIPELATTRATALLDTVAATAGTGTLNACSNSSLLFGGSTGAGSGTAAAYNLIIVAADGTIGNSNLSNGKAYLYAPTLKGSHVLTHTQGGGTFKSQIGVTYDSSCAQTTTQPSTVTDNDGVSLATLTAGITSRLAFVPDSISNFTTDLAWTSNYGLNTAGSTAVIQVQSTSAYAGNTFYVEYGGSLYTGVFPSTQLAADQSINTTLALTKVTSVGNPLLAP
mgnify:CR=1 FL=1